MPVNYTIYRDNRRESENLFYGRAVHMNVLDLDGLAENIQEKCTVNKADCHAVLVALVSEMKKALEDSKVVKLDGFGSFRATIHTTGATSLEEFDIQKQLKGVKVNFLAEGKVVTAGGKRTTIRKMLSDVKLKKYGE